MCDVTHTRYVGPVKGVMENLDTYSARYTEPNEIFRTLCSFISPSWVNSATKSRMAGCRCRISSCMVRERIVSTRLASSQKAGTITGYSQGFTITGP